MAGLSPGLDPRLVSLKKINIIGEYDHLNMRCAALTCALRRVRLEPVCSSFCQEWAQSIPMQCERQKICRCVVAVAEVKSSACKILSRSTKMMRVRAAERVAESVECRL